ncbi:MAG TPA: hypothetical protein VK928_09805 [Longimicrobiales bacterium]|nr:hypothetical protein [Longimicrobiales bacterium]
MKAVLLLCLGIIACGPSGAADADDQAPVALLAEIRPGVPLDSLLYLIDNHLVQAMAGGLDDEGTTEFLRAEALSDRLLEARAPFEWIEGDAYSLQSRLRQVQSAADRVRAQIQTAAPREQTLGDLRTLRNDVVQLRRALTLGGTRAPPDIYELLASDTVRLAPGAGAEPSGPTAPRGPQPLGSPVPPP